MTSARFDFSYPSLPLCRTSAAIKSVQKLLAALPFGRATVRTRQLVFGPRHIDEGPLRLLPQLINTNAEHACRYLKTRSITRLKDDNHISIMSRTGRGAVRKPPPPLNPHKEQLLHEEPSRPTQMLIFAALFVMCLYCACICCCVACV